MLVRVCVFMCHGQQPLTLYTSHTQWEITEKREKQKKKKEKWWWGHQNTLVSNGYATYETNWFMGGFFVLKGTTPFLPSRLCQPLHHPGTQASLLSFAKEGEKKQNTWSCSTFNAGQDRVLPLDKVACQRLAHRAQPIWKAPAAFTPTCMPHGPLHCRNDCVRARVCVRTYVRKEGMFPSPLCMNHKERVGMFGKAEGGGVGRGCAAEGRRGGGEAEAVIWEGGYPTMQIKHMVRTLCCGRRETNRGKTESFTQLHYDLKKGLTSPMKATRPRD